MSSSTPGITHPPIRFVEYPAAVSISGDDTALMHHSVMPLT
jgi:hypothetical protein